MTRKRSDGENGGVRRRHLRFWGILFGIPVFLLLLYGCWWIYAEKQMSAALARAGADGWPVTTEKLQETVYTATPEEVAAWLAEFDAWRTAVGEPPEELIFNVHEWERMLDDNWRALLDRAEANSKLLNEPLLYMEVPVAYNWENPGETQLPHLFRLHMAGKVLAGFFRLAAADGDAEQALYFWRDGRRAIALLKHETTLIASLVETSSDEKWFEALNAAALAGELRCFSEEQLQEMADSLDAVPVSELYQRCGGLEMHLFAFASSWRGLGELGARLERDGKSDSSAWTHLWRVLCSYSPYGRSQAASQIDYYRRLFSVLDSDWYEVRFSLPQAPEAWNGCPVLWGCLDGRDLVKTGSKLSAERRTCRCGIALELYRRKFGHFPENLEDLVTADLLDAVPVDPFDGRPLRYAVGPHSFEWRKAVADKSEPEVTTVKRDAATVWSIGRNCVDDGGMDGPGAKGDVVFAVAETRETEP